MPRESVVGALETIHRVLRPGGVFFDIHPRTELSPVAVMVGVRREEFGALTWSDAFATTITLAEGALDGAEGDGLFGNERVVEFDVLNHFATMGDWAAYREEQAPFYVPTEPTMVAALADAMAPDGPNGPEGPEGPEVVMGEFVRATRYRKLG
jgi:hypothetical protein